jgi:vacuolar protein sorting-associated protein 51
MSDDEDFDTRSDDSGEGGNTMMSLLSSYYGIEEEVKTEEKVAETSSDIDAVGFNHQGYVKNLLCTLEMQDLLKEDIKMVHDIKTLDSDMQMLVYENYNKFISATETIKKMKTNVEAMDSDMESVRVKMQSICEKTKTIDQSLAGKRAQIDKLVRIKRLLNRLVLISNMDTNTLILNYDTCYYCK